MKRHSPDEKKSYSEGQMALYSEMTQKYPAVYRYFYAGTGSRVVAEELLQETYMKAWKSLDRISDQKRDPDFIMVIAHGTLFDYYRKSYRERRVLYFTADPLVDHDDDDVIPRRVTGIDQSEVNAFADQMIEEENYRRIMEQLRQMDERYSRPLHLWIFGGFSEKEIAELLGLNYNTVRSRISRGRKMLAKIYQATKGDDADEG